MYTITLYGTLLRHSDNASIPVDIKNRDYRKYLEWVDAGNIAEVEQATDPIAEREQDANVRLARPENRVLFKAIFKQENRIRALEGLVPLTESEYTSLAKASYFEEIS